MKHPSLVFLLLFTLSVFKSQSQEILLSHPPQHYICYYTTESIVTDGLLDEKSWENVPWSAPFVDIEGDEKPLPYYQTNVKMVWDQHYLYIGARLEEPNIWATLTERESVIYYDNDFEVFIDPDGDTHNYYELEMNAFGTVWDLMLTKPYSVMGVPINSWDIAGLKSGIHLNGTINNPADTDTCWTLEMAIPWEVLRECNQSKSKPGPQDKWRINFSRVQWKLDKADGKYKKANDPANDKPYPEHNWVWSPQWAINMHKPEYWGYLQFSEIEAGKGVEQFVPDNDFKTQVILRELFNAQQQFFKKNKSYSNSIENLEVNLGLIHGFDIKTEAINNRFKISAKEANAQHWWSITEDSRIWCEGK